MLTSSVRSRAGSPSGYVHDVGFTQLPGWGQLTTPSQPQQKGKWGEAIGTQWPGSYPGVQRHCIAGDLNSGWVVPTSSDIPYWQVAQLPGNAPGVQRTGAAHSAGPGLVEYGFLRGAVLAQQLSASGPGPVAAATGVSRGTVNA